MEWSIIIELTYYSSRKNVISFSHSEVFHYTGPNDTVCRKSIYIWKFSTRKGDKIELHSLFITPIFSLQLEGHKHIIHDIYKLKQEDIRRYCRDQMYGGWHSDDEIYTYKRNFVL